MTASERHSRAMELFDEVCELPSARRATYLEHQCSKDRDLLREVESLLKHDMDAGAAVAAIDGGKGVDLLAADLAAESLEKEAADAEVLPDRIGSYCVIRLIGQGGMGVVYETRQENPDRRVALKIIRRGLSSRQAAKRFQNEAHILGLLQHAGIAHIYEAGHARVGGERVQFFAMEYVDGQPIDAYVNQRDLCARARLELVARVCDAVHYAHEKGVIHRDIKPANILVVDQDDGSGAERPIAPLHSGTSSPCDVHERCSGRPKILDFGVARLTDADMQMVTLQTEVGQLVGTLSHMSP